MNSGLMFGPSMLPSMGRVNFVWLEPFDFITVGDVVCFTRKNKIGRLIHRVIDIDAQGKVYIKGDNAPEVDCVSLSEIFSKVAKFRKLL